MAAVSELPWEELHGNLRAFISRRVRNPADVDDRCSECCSRSSRASRPCVMRSGSTRGCIASLETSSWTTTARRPLCAKSPAAIRKDLAAASDESGCLTGR